MLAYGLVCKAIITELLTVGYITSFKDMVESQNLNINNVTHARLILTV